jgi:hypothetical protein
MHTVTCHPGLPQLCPSFPSSASSGWVLSGCFVFAARCDGLQSLLIAVSVDRARSAGRALQTSSFIMDKGLPPVSHSTLLPCEHMFKK